MKASILITSMNNFGSKGFYNSQEIGLAKELDKVFTEVVIYKHVSFGSTYTTEKIESCSNTSVVFIPTKQKGINGMPQLNEMDKNIDVLIYFSDTQLAVPKVYEWAKKNNITFIPYIGVIESHSTNKVKKLIINYFFQRNLSVYKKCRCLVKTPSVKNELRAKGVNDIAVTPVGLDFTLLKSNYQAYDTIFLKSKYGYKKDEKVLLFIGRIIDEKQPLSMIEIFEEIYKTDNSYRLLMVGKGELEDAVKNMIDKKCLTQVVNLIEQIPNKDIWELYRISEAFINLNQQEIFGMAILEAMYYESTVIAFHAPGPSFIIEDNVSGYLIQDKKEVIKKLLGDKKLDKEAIRFRVIDNFTWEHAANIIPKLIRK